MIPGYNPIPFFVSTFIEFHTSFREMLDKGTINYFLEFLYSVLASAMRLGYKREDTSIFKLLAEIIYQVWFYYSWTYIFR